MAYRVTPLLSFGDPPPAFPHASATEIADAVAQPRAGRAVHVDDEHVAEEALRELIRSWGRVSSFVAQLMHLARTGVPLPEGHFCSAWYGRYRRHCRWLNAGHTAGRRCGLT